MRWCVELVSQTPTDEAKVNFGLERSNILLHIAYRRAADQLVINRRTALGWAVAEVFATQPTAGHAASLYLTIETLGEAVVLRWPGGQFRPAWLAAEDLEQCASWTEGLAVWHAQGSAARLPWPSWRASRAPSGFPAHGRALADRLSTPPAAGASFIIRAKNEAPTVQPCLRGIAGLADEIIFADNDSSDATFSLANRMKSECFELRTFAYAQSIPRAGAEHAREVLAGGGNTLGHFYNWCLARARHGNIIKWDADYLALRENLAEMIAQFDLRTRGDNFALWFSGLEVYTDGKQFWVDQNSCHSEFRAFSLRHGHHWVNLPPWEELDQNALFRAQKLFYRKPVYLEIFRLSEIEFRDRGLFADNTRDRERFGYIQQFRATGEVPAHFRPIAGLEDRVLRTLPLSARELDLADYKDCHFRAMPRLSLASEEAAVGFEMARQGDFAVFIISCARNTARQAVIAETWAADLARLGIPYYFVIGRPGQGAHIVGDTLFLDVPDSYEFLASKLAAALEFSLARLNVDYVFKIDDDCVLDAQRLLLCDYRCADFSGGALAGGAYSFSDWHGGKCRNEQLDDLACFPQPGAVWVGGQFGYFLSVAARVALVAAGAGLRRSLYEDYGVTMVLAGQGIVPRVPFGDYVSVKYEDGAWRDRADVVVIADTPDAGVQREVYAAAVGGGLAGGQVRVECDWMDFQAVRRVLLREAAE